MVNYRLFRFAGALYEKSREYERPKPLSEAISVILGAESYCGSVTWDSSQLYDSSTIRICMSEFDGRLIMVFSLDPYPVLQVTESVQSRSLRNKFYAAAVSIF